MWKYESYFHTKINKVFCFVWSQRVKKEGILFHKFANSKERERKLSSATAIKVAQTQPSFIYVWARD